MAKNCPECCEIVFTGTLNPTQSINVKLPKFQAVNGKSWSPRTTVVKHLRKLSSRGADPGGAGGAAAPPILILVVQTYHFAPPIIPVHK